MVSEFLRTGLNVLKTNPRYMKSFAMRHTADGDNDKILACLRLRHSYFCLARKWAPCNDSERETDIYDSFSHHLAVSQNNQILAYMRLLSWQEKTGFMLEHDFACLLTDEERHLIVHERSAEISRLVVANTFQANSTGNAEKSDQPTGRPNPFAHLHALYLLFRLFFHTARQNDIETFYIVVEPPTLRLLQRKFGIPFIPLGNTYTFPDGTVTQAAFTTLSETERSIAAKFPERYEWYRQAP